MTAQEQETRGCAMPGCCSAFAEIERLRETLRTLIGEAQYYVKDDQGYTITSLSEAIADARAALEGR